jgi:type IV pilus assembly protein PilA
MMKKTQQGFTLIELMIVVAIVGILAALALPAYQDYTIRSKISEGLARGAEAKTSIAEYFSSKGHMPDDTSTAGFNSIGSGMVSSVTCASASCVNINITMNVTEIPQLSAGPTLQLSVKSTTNGIIVWTCKTVDMATKYLPGSCR